MGLDFVVRVLEGCLYTGTDPLPFTDDVFLELSESMANVGVGYFFCSVPPEEPLLDERGPWDSLQFRTNTPNSTGANQGEFSSDFVKAHRTNLDSEMICLYPSFKKKGHQVGHALNHEAHVQKTYDYIISQCTLSEEDQRLLQSILFGPNIIAGKWLSLHYDY